VRLARLRRNSSDARRLRGILDGDALPRDNRQSVLDLAVLSRLVVSRFTIIALSILTVALAAAIIMALVRGSDGSESPVQSRAPARGTQSGSAASLPNSNRAPSFRTIHQGSIE